VLGTGAFDMAIQRLELERTIAEIEYTIANIPEDWAAAQQELSELEPQLVKVRQALLEAPMMDQIAMALEPLILRSDQWAVRSSATVEDNPRYSFAGQFLSLLSMPGGVSLWDAIRRVWASAFSREVLAYCAQNASPMPRMAVILQPMAPVTVQDRSGVAFSHSPVPSMPGVLIQAAFGTGQVVVGGYGGDIYGVKEEEVNVQAMPPAEIRISSPEGDTEPESSPQELSLTEEEARQLATITLAVAEQWGRPVDLEFIWRAGEPPLLVQVRSVASR
jgi:phosphoenolpyruvate synthase/pyruvate phosphate dikinase